MSLIHPKTKNEPLTPKLPKYSPLELTRDQLFNELSSLNENLRPVFKHSTINPKRDFNACRVYYDTIN